MITAAPFRFDADAHEYIDLETGAVLAHITQMLEATGWVNSRWFTDESRQRGTAVHKLTADFDLGALDVRACVSPYRGYLLGHVAAMEVLKPDILSVEEPIVHPAPRRFGGRPDRVVRLYGLLGVLEIKSGGKEPCHPIQTALQAMLVAIDQGLPPECLSRWCLYLKPSGKFTLEHHRAARDFREASRIVTAVCGA